MRASKMIYCYVCPHCNRTFEGSAIVVVRQDLVGKTLTELRKRQEEEARERGGEP